MNRLFLEKNISILLFQRNLLVVFSILFGIALILLSSFLFLKRERVVIIPSHIEKEFWLDSHTVSPTYVEQMGYFLAQLLLTKSPQSAASQRTVLLRHTDASYSGILRKKLIEEEEILKKQNASYVFYPSDIQVNQEKMSLLLNGERQFLVGGKQISSSQESYELYFYYTGSGLLLKEIVANEKK